MGEKTPLPSDVSLSEPDLPVASTASETFSDETEPHLVEEPLWDPNAKEPSEAAKDQGWGPPPPPKTIDSTKQPSTPQDFLYPSASETKVTDEERKASQAGAPLARAALEDARRKGARLSRLATKQHVQRARTALEPKTPQSTEAEPPKVADIDPRELARQLGVTVLVTRDAEGHKVLVPQLPKRQ